MQFVAYYRVSTKKQGRSGLGMQAQKDAVARHLKTTGGKLIASFSEVESGTVVDRPELEKAVAFAKKKKATLMIAKLDRFGRKAWFMLKLINESGVDFYFCDMPSADKLTIGVMALMAEREADMISERTKAALAVKKAKGFKLGNPNLDTIRPKAHAANRAKTLERAQGYISIIEDIETKGRVNSLRKIADALNARGIETPRKGKWTATSVRRVKLAAAA